MISICPNISKENSNCFHKLSEQFIVGFIIFINQFIPRKKMTFIKERSRTIILNMIPNSLNKMTLFIYRINIFTTPITQMTSVYNFYPSNN